MRFGSVAAFLCFSALGFIATYVARGSSDVNAVHVDHEGKRWRVPTSGWVTWVANKCIEMIPRFNGQFQMIDPDFDLEEESYLVSSSLYIGFCGLIGCLFVIIVVIYLIGQNVCGCCGGKKPPRGGFSKGRINGRRMMLAFFSFLLEGCLIYSYFVNADLHTSGMLVVDRFQQFGVHLGDELSKLTASVPNQTGEPEVDLVMQEFSFRDDLEFSKKYAVLQTNVMYDLLNRFEGLRMALLLLNLIIATFACSVGIAAGSVNRAWPIIVMLGCNCVSCTIIFFSAGTHFAGSKIIFEYCDEIHYYLEDGNTDIIPMRLQFFVPCIASPLFPFLEQYYIVNAVQRVDTFNELLRTTNVYRQKGSLLRDSLAFWFNVSDPYYALVINETENVTLREQLTESHADAAYFAELLTILKANEHCDFSKAAMRDEQWLMCVYAKDNLDMLTAFQVVGAVLLAIITVIAVPAVREFAYAGKADFGGILNGGRKIGGPKAKAKRAK
jgi:hypothetical protein